MIKGIIVDFFDCSGQRDSIDNTSTEGMSTNLYGAIGNGIGCCFSSREDGLCIDCLTSIAEYDTILNYEFGIDMLS